MAQDGLAAFEPAFVDELAVDAALGPSTTCSATATASRTERTWLRDETGGSVYLRLSTRPIEQPQRAMTPRPARGDIVDGAYWLRRPGPNAEVVVAYTGAVAPEAIEAVGPDGRGPPRRRPARRDLGRPAQRRLDGGAARPRARACPCPRAISSGCSPTCRAHCGLVTVIDGHPATLAWLGAVAGHRTRSLGVEHFGQTGTIADLYRHYGIDANAIIAAAAGDRAGPADPASARPRLSAHRS